MYRVSVEFWYKSTALLAFYDECRSLIDYATHYLLSLGVIGSSVAVCSC